MKIKWSRSIVVAATLGLYGASAAAWTGQVIHPAGNNFSAVFGAGQNISVGQHGEFLTKAGIWTNSGQTFLSLHHEGWTSSLAAAGNSSRIVGHLQNPGNVHAITWFGSPNAWQDLNPLGFSHSAADAIWEDETGGYAVSDGNGSPWAIMWHGAGAEDYTLLHPRERDSSGIKGMDENEQVGWVSADLFSQAAKWNGSAESLVLLNPTGALGSVANATWDGQQVGYGSFEGHNRAFLWSGTAESAVDLHPIWAESSEAVDIQDGYQVGDSFDGTDYHATLWSGSSMSAVDLHPFLPEGFSKSWATSLEVYEDRVEVYGYAIRPGAERMAVMWTQPVPEPATIVCLAAGFGALLRKRRAKRSSR